VYDLLAFHSNFIVLYLSLFLRYVGLLPVISVRWPTTVDKHSSRATFFCYYLNRICDVIARDMFPEAEVDYPSRSVKVIGNGMVQQIINDFLLPIDAL